MMFLLLPESIVCHHHYCSVVTCRIADDPIRMLMCRQSRSTASDSCSMLRQHLLSFSIRRATWKCDYVGRCDACKPTWKTIESSPRTNPIAGRRQRKMFTYFAQKTLRRLHVEMSSSRGRKVVSGARHFLARISKNRLTDKQRKGADLLQGAVEII